MVIGIILVRLPEWLNINRGLIVEMLCWNTLIWKMLQDHQYLRSGNSAIPLRILSFQHRTYLNTSTKIWERGTWIRRREAVSYAESWSLRARYFNTIFLISVESSCWRSVNSPVSEADIMTPFSLNEACMLVDPFSSFRLNKFVDRLLLTPCSGASLTADICDFARSIFPGRITMELLRGQCSKKLE